MKGGERTAPPMRSELGTPKFTVLRPTFSPCQNRLSDMKAFSDLMCSGGCSDMADQMAFPKTIACQNGTIAVRHGAVLHVPGPQ